MLENLFEICTQILENQRQIMNELGIESEYEKRILSEFEGVKPTPHNFGNDESVSLEDILTPKLK